MITIHLALLIAAFLCFLLTALNVVAPRLNLLGLGLAFWVLAVMIV
jgi:hypothetical protein